jgi:integrase
MAALNKLSSVAVEKMKAPGIYPDGGGLCLQVAAGKKGIGKSWVLRYSHRGKARAMGLGAYPRLSLADARDRRDWARGVLNARGDPITEREREREAKQLAEAQRMTFGQCAAAYIAAHEASWRNPKHRQQWSNTLALYANPIIGDLPVDQVDVGFVMRVLEPIWSTKPETASRLRGRIEAVLDWARVRGYRQGENPARWKGNLDHLLPAKGKISVVKHHEALDYREMADFMEELRARDGIAARALEFAILTAARTGEVIGATWGEIDIDAKLWTVPGSRMKSCREHRVPLSDAAVVMLNTMPRFSIDPRVFPISNMGMPMLLRRMGRGELTVHGFRSTFRDWAGDMTAFQREVVEAALAHTVGDKAEQAYRRGDALEKRRKLMDAWASFCAKPQSAKIIALHC